MTERKLKLLSEIIQEKDDEIAAYQDKTVKQANDIAEKDDEIAEKANKIAELEARISFLESQQPALANE